MIIAYTGLLGSGKSYGVVENVIIPNLKKGRKICTNIPLRMGNLIDAGIDTDLIYKLDLVKEVDDFGEKDNPNEQYYYLDESLKGKTIYDHVVKGCIYVLDEVQLHLPSDIKSNEVTSTVKKFYSKSRHFTDENGFVTDIVFVTQDLKNTSAFLRSLIAKTYHVTKLDALGKLGNNRYRVDIYKEAITGTYKPQSNFIISAHGKYLPEVFKFYESNTESDAKETEFLNIQTDQPDKRGNLFNRPIFKIGIPFVFIAVILSSYSLYSLFNPEEIKKRSDLVGKNKTGLEVIDPIKKTNKYFKKAKDNSSLLSKVGLSQDTHISSHIEFAGDKIIKISDGENTLIINNKYCFDSPDFGLICSLNNEVITAKSGKASKIYNDDNLAKHYSSSRNRTSNKNKKPIITNPFKKG